MRSPRAGEVAGCRGLVCASRFRGVVAHRTAGYLSGLARNVLESYTMFESLESRMLFAATVADASPATTALNFTKAETYSLKFTKIKYDTKVAMQDFHFVMKHNASSPT